MFYVYVLKSQIADRMYVGSAEDVQERLRMHNAGKVRSTKPYKPYIVIYSEEYSTRGIARKRELQIKRSGKLRKMIKENTDPIV